MKPEFEIQLRDVVMHAYHGVLPEERKLGNQYRVNVRLRIDASDYDPEADDISKTVSYADVFELLQTEMSHPCKLLESVAVRISTCALEKWPGINGGMIEIVKIVPPIHGMIGEAGVRYIF